MSTWKLFLSVCAIGAHALPSKLENYAVKETHFVPRSWSLVGDAPKSANINLQLGLKQQNEGAIEQHLLEISDPAHARYGQHLSAEEVHDLVTPAEESLNLVSEWLAEHGVSKSALSPSKDWISISVPIEKAEELLQTTYSIFKHADGSTLYRTPEWSLPLHLHEHIDVVQPTTSFLLPRAKKTGAGILVGGPSQPLSWYEETGKAMFGLDKASDKSVAAVCNASFVTPECLRTVYGTINYVPKAAGKNKISLADFLNETNRRTDIKKFLNTFRPEAAGEAETFKLVNIANAQNNQGALPPAAIEAGQDIEGNLDAEAQISISYPTPLTAFLTGGMPPFIPDLGTSTDTNEPYLTFLNYVLGQKDLPQVLSISYGDEEQTVPESYAKRACSGFAQLGSRGISVIVSSGDSGVGGDNDCFSNSGKKKREFIPNFPTSCPFVTSVGATASFNPEVAVSRFGSGAGFSNYFAQPKYQSKVVDAYIAGLDGEYNGLYNKSGRAYPDVAAQGNHDAIVWLGNITTVGGTSASAPTFAAVIALVNDALLAKGKPTLGFLNPWIYGGAYKALTDITSGSSIGCNTAGFPAKKGWDAVTGFGTPNFGKLVDEAFDACA